ncbi:MAG: hypothetical protein JO156_01235 [Solirubrobacterales bacterium]|nr:hypothetical protein [Solirubrobacterales bacterium]
MLRGRHLLTCLALLISLALIGAPAALAASAAGSLSGASHVTLVAAHSTALGPSQTLPRTGLDIWLTGLLGLALVAGGVGVRQLQGIER